MRVYKKQGVAYRMAALKAQEDDPSPMFGLYIISA